MNPPVVPHIPDNAPFTLEQRAWLNGFLAGWLGQSTAPSAAAVESEPKKSLLILFGSQSGTAEGLSRKIAKSATGKGLAGKVMDLAEYQNADLAHASRVLIVTSTWGEGEMPDNAKPFWDWLSSESAPRLESTSFAVLALGDKNYQTFCQAGKEIDRRLGELGAKRLLDRLDCDTDYELVVDPWIDKALQEFNGIAEAKSSTNGAAPKTNVSQPTPAATSGYSKNNPFLAKLIDNRNLNKEGSQKEVRHIGISLEGSGLTYEVGDALGLIPTNDPALVAMLLEALKWTSDTPIVDGAGKSKSARDFFLRDCDIHKVPMALLQGIASKAPSSEVAELLKPENKPALEKFLWGRDCLDLISEYNRLEWIPSEVSGWFKKLSPRLYSISSSPKAHPGEVHLTVGAVRYEARGRARGGTASTYLADRVPLGDTLPVYVQISKSFRLPEDPTRSIIMVGPGTGIAPFRAFIEERKAINATGENWLFFGDQKKSTDFLYEDELMALQKEGYLHHLETAFSRDQEEKIYVQHRMIERGADLWKWLESGAHFYVCGDASRMAKDVDAALHKVIQTHGGKSPEEAIAYVAKMKTEKRYQRDVY